MEKQYQGFKMIRTEKLATKYGFSASDKKIRVKAELFDTDSDIVFEEAILVRQLYCDEVAKCKAAGEKPKPQAIKTYCFQQAETDMLNKYGNQYTQLMGGKVVKEYTPKKIVEIKEDKEEVDEQVVKEVNQEFEDNLDSLMSEFTSSEPVVKIKQVDLSNLDIMPTTTEFKPKKDMVEDNIVEDEVAVEDLSVFDVELDIGDLFDF